MRIALLRPAIAATGLALLQTSALWAQDVSEGPRFTFGIEQRFEAGRNIDLETPSEGTTTAAITRVTLGYVTETRTQSLAFQAAAGLRFANEPDDGDETEVDTPRLEVVYTRTGANAVFTADLSYQRERLDEIGLAEDTDNPDDVNDLQGGGTRTVYALGTALELGTEGPFGFGLRARRSATDYSDTTDEDLTDSTSTSFGATARLQFSPVWEGRIEADHTLDREDDPGGTDRDTTVLAFGLTRALPNGTADGRLAFTDDTFADRVTLDFGRAMDLPAGALSARIGVTKAEDNDAALVGLIDWRQDLPDGSIGLRLSQSETSTDTGGITTVSLASLGYAKDIGPQSSIGLDVTMARIEETGANDVDRVDLTARYRRELTADWGLDLGAAYQTRREENVGRANSPSVFLSLNRNFEFRP